MTRPFPQIPDQIPMDLQDFVLVRCALCGDVLPGSWGVSQKEARAGVEHAYERHAVEIAANALPRPPFVNCAIQDPFWFEEHAHA